MDNIDVFRLAMACKFFGGLTTVLRLATALISTESAGGGEKRRRLTGLAKAGILQYIKPECDFYKAV